MKDRRDFFKTLGLGALVTAVVPQVATLKMKEEIATKHVPSSSSQQFHHFETPLSPYDRETMIRMHEYVQRQK